MDLTWARSAGQLAFPHAHISWVFVFREINICGGNCARHGEVRVRSFDNQTPPKSAKTIHSTQTGRFTGVTANPTSCLKKKVESQGWVADWDTSEEQGMIDHDAVKYVEPFRNKLTHEYCESHDRFEVESRQEVLPVKTVINFRFKSYVLLLRIGSDGERQGPLFLSCNHLDNIMVGGRRKCSPFSLVLMVSQSTEFHVGHLGQGVLHNEVTQFFWDTMNLSVFLLCTVVSV